MFSNFPRWVIVTLVSLLVVLPFARTKLVGDSHLRTHSPRKRGYHAIYAVGDPSEIAISASNYKTINGSGGQKVAFSSTGRCSKVIDAESGTFETPCTFSTRLHDQVYHAECTNGKGSASLYFSKLEGSANDQSVQVLTAGNIWAGFSNKKRVPLKQGTLNNDGDRVAVILNCENDKRGRY
ncbi:uncharacterized protein FA14DRAFT_155359 [Meira miltonrushii]|uniref:Uncharacterized protein n=1 Tax=Meira miltonrushii TaxID=1280837 RepID=A0A316VEI9_9BASI|nr:uncharacterized protein FA14DRAFT_155359 [Meira miltonrushii]PWN35946.1 hypothetical protein FA14DRAFT_155359 [Meira miltonrushii]